MTDDDLPLLTQKQAAALGGVALRTFRAWELRAAAHEGRSPRYSIADVLAEKERRTWADPNVGRSRRGGPKAPNVFRMLLECHHDVAAQALSNGWSAWYADGDWRQIAGLSEAQGREIAWRAYAYSAMCLSVFLFDGKFEALLKENEGHDLDGFMKMFFGIDRKTAWTEDGGAIALSGRIRALVPADVLERLDRTSLASNGHG